MKIVLMVTGKTVKSWLREGVEEYARRISKYIPFEIATLPDIRNTGNRSALWVKENEAVKILEALKSDDYAVLLDEHGKTYTTLEFASWLERMVQMSKKRIVFIAGGPWGLHESVRARADHVVSLSRLTFSHQLVRLLFAEQLYRALTIIAGDPYHHE